MAIWDFNSPTPPKNGKLYTEEDFNTNTGEDTLYSRGVWEGNSWAAYGASKALSEAAATKQAKELQLAIEPHLDIADAQRLSITDHRARCRPAFRLAGFDCASIRHHVLHALWLQIRNIICTKCPVGGHALINIEDTGRFHSVV